MHAVFMLPSFFFIGKKEEKVDLRLLITQNYARKLKNNNNNDKQRLSTNSKDKQNQLKTVN